MSWEETRLERIDPSILKHGFVQPRTSSRAPERKICQSPLTATLPTKINLRMMMCIHFQLSKKKLGPCIRPRSCQTFTLLFAAFHSFDLGKTCCAYGRKVFQICSLLTFFGILDKIKLIELINRSCIFI